MPAMKLPFFKELRSKRCLLACKAINRASQLSAWVVDGRTYGLSKISLSLSLSVVQHVIAAAAAGSIEYKILLVVERYL